MSGYGVLDGADVLVADPDRHSLQATTAYLEGEGSEVTAAINPSEAVEHANTDTYDAVVSEYRFRESDATGLDILDSVREEYPEMPFVMYASSGSEEAAAKAVQKGADSYVRKEEDGAEVLMDELSRSMEELKEENFYQGLLSTAIHDSNNHLNVGLGHVEILRDRYDDDSLDAVHRSLTKLENLMDGLDSLRSGKTQQVDVYDMVEDAAEYYREAGHDIDISYSVPDGEAVLEANPLLRSGIENLLQNGIDHSEASHIDISVREADHELEIVYEDDGRGLPDDIRDNLFEFGMKGKDSNGMGLGTAILWRSVRSSGGTVEAGKSEEGGARFEVRLPRD
ncbi:MAG: hybrid sensor histidine kinase/response regulator [Candidatus Nanohaloarchaea archaeon]